MSSRAARKLRLPSEEGRLPNRAGQHLGAHLGIVCSRPFAPVRQHSQMGWGAGPGRIQGEHSGGRAASPQMGGGPEAKLVCHSVLEKIPRGQKKKNCAKNLKNCL